MKYDTKYNNEVGWIVEENKFDKNYLGKCETIMCLGNGYMGIRSATEENYQNEKRNTFVAGTFNKFDDNEVTELPNVADVFNIKLKLNDEILDLTLGKVNNYSRQLNLKTGELKREFQWTNSNGELFQIVFKRFVSLDDLHLIGHKIEVTPMTDSLNISLTSTINGQMTNSGVQHFSEGEKRLYDNKYLQMVQTTTESKVDIVINSFHNFYINDKKIDIKGLVYMDRRLIGLDYSIDVEKGNTFIFEKFTNIYTSRDKELKGATLNDIKSISYENIKKIDEYDYNFHLSKSVNAWESKVWSKYDIYIDTDEILDKMAIRFAHYHLTVMTPAHDNRMNIGAKGLSGEGYKGHTFWDTEIFMLPFFTYTNPEVARSLLEYRYLSLKGAHKKAKENGYEGAMFPWESAWLEDGEVTPVWGAADIVTGKSTKIWSGFIEQHITSDIAFACWQYYCITNDDDFMDKYGYELFMDTAKFWQSRLEWNEEKNRYEINDVVGPDEYKEHVNNNAFTNYTAHWTINNAIKYYDLLKNKKTDIFNNLCEKINLEEAYKKWIEKVDKIYLPKPNDENLVIPQDDTYLEKKIIDLTKYKNQENVGSLFKDYNLHSVNNMQISKQADVMILFYLLENLFDKKVKIANWNYYEPKTLHDSSLSLSTHSILANDLENYQLAYDLFTKACKIDLGPNMKTSDHGIHAASLGGIWQCIVCGFGGVRMIDSKLRIEPKLPVNWRKLKYPINWHGDRLLVTVNKDDFVVENVTMNNDEIIFINKDKEYKLNNKISVSI